jgi:hypothetical protein
MWRLVCSCLSYGIFSFAVAAISVAEDPAPGSPPAESPPVKSPAENQPGQRWAVILVGIPGDAEHEPLFHRTADVWEKWLTTALEFEPDHVIRLPAPAKAGAEPRTGLTAETILKTFADLTDKLREEDSLWVFTLGHGNYDGKHAWFHVAGRDPSNEDFGRWVGEIRCHEQVFCLTQANSGWFVKPLAKPGRIVIAATAADDESNETEFPEALATIAGRSAGQLDTDGDGQVSVAELFVAIAAEVLKRFQSDKRLPTEHAQLDDNGDGRGTEEISLKEPPPPEDASPAGTLPATVQPPQAKVDGQSARKTFVPYRQAVKPKSKEGAPE